MVPRSERVGYALRCTLSVLLLLGVFVAGPGHQLVHVLAGETGHGSSGHGSSGHGSSGHGSSGHTGCDASPAHDAALAAEDSVRGGPSSERVEPRHDPDHEHLFPDGACALCQLALGLPSAAIVRAKVSDAGMAAPIWPSTGIHAVVRDRSRSERGPPQVA
ncbi:hypothetical protein [Engelhardtia mirabilis]|uniref:DUF2946 domain-containing protein n=1 Tax=Engelhardtia mirabilis TaxID=2528011 RepID=A0A518BQB4_9BACT|nr:hypothetical protein Pla133_42800 [Planctomycetes bacterium Pla133]QDV03490.1 hypothetical protein Pla86_42790 [Planctomycetes bacterium Pla86]